MSTTTPTSPKSTSWKMPLIGLGVFSLVIEESLLREPDPVDVFYLVDIGDTAVEVF